MKEGAGKARYPLIPMVRVQQKSTRQNHRISQISGLPAQWLYGLYVIFPGTGLIAPVIPALVNSAGIWHQHRDARTTRFTVRIVLFVGAKSALQPDTPIASRAQRP
jgi:hypothetical protein